jgi:4-amino-4-deoxy-L-arabinose transferase-like glycosyltransferase
MGFGRSALPPRPGWNWAQDYKTNIETGHRPPPALLAASRFPSTIYLAVSAIVMFGIGWQFGRRPMAYVLSALYVLNPIVLLNGRRAMLEGSLLCFGLLTIWLAILIIRGRNRWYWWAAFTVSGALAVAGKHTGAIFTASALGWILLAAGRGVLPKLLISAATMVLLFVAFSPALWANPVARVRDLIAHRRAVLDLQDHHRPTSMAQRVDGILRQPFLTPPAHFEPGPWTDFTPIKDEIDRYSASPLSGVPFGRVVGLPLTLLAIWGMVALVLRRRSWERGVLLWFAITAGALLVTPLPWQRYYLPLIPVASVLAGVAGLSLLQGLSARSHSREPSRGPGPGEVEAADGAKRVQHLTAEKEAGMPHALERLRMHLVQRDAAAGHFRLLITLVTGPGQRTGRQPLDEREALGAAQLGDEAVGGN